MESSRIFPANNITRIKLGIHEAGTYLGRSLTKRALKQEKHNFEVVAVCHKLGSKKPFMSHPNLQVITADLFTPENMRGVFDDCDVIISCLGGRRSCSMLPTRTTLYSEATRVLIDSMAESEIRRIESGKRQAEETPRGAGSNQSRISLNGENEQRPIQLVFVSTWGTKSLLDKWDEAREPKAEGHFKQCVVRPHEFRKNVADLDTAESFLLDADTNPFKSNTTIVRAPEIVNSEREYVAKQCEKREKRNSRRMHFEENKSYVLNSHERISASDLSKFLLKCVTEKLANGKVIAVGLFDSFN